MQSEAEVAVRMSQKTELDLFSKPLEQNVILSVHDFQYGPESVITQNGPIQFSPATNNEYFTDLANVYLKVQLQVFKSDGSVLTEADEDKVKLYFIFSICLLFMYFCFTGSPSM